MSRVARYALDNPNAIKELHKDIRRHIKQAATKTVNAVAFQARADLRTYVLENFSNPNGLVTPSSLFVKKVPFGKTENLNDIQASVGFSEKVDFMRRQDEGGWRTRHDPSRRMSIKTDAAERDGLPTRGSNKSGKVRIKGKKVSTVRIKNGKSKSRRANRVARAAMAYQTGLPMFMGENKSLFRITSFTRIDDGVHFGAELMVNRKFTRTFTPARNFFLPVCQNAAKNIQDLFSENMDKF
ncbi:MAG: hypothetical protein FWB80_14950 [Defluviitaleaceae bacterium]|nr:hypothetical protein [Defluviitaleaceae bacterium]